MTFARDHLDETKRIIDALDVGVIDRMAEMLAALRQKGGRLFFLGVGGSAGNCSHAVNDFRKIAGIEAYAPTDNVSELTARTNDEGWETVFVEWLKVSRLKADDAVFVFSVGGGSLEKNVSPNLVRALQYAKSVGAKILGVVGRDGGYTAKVGDAVCIVPTVNPDAVTPHSEAFQAVIWHLLVTHPALKAKQTKWEGVERADARMTGRVPRPRRRSQQSDRAQRQALFAGYGRRDGHRSGRTGGRGHAAPARLPPRSRDQPARCRARPHHARAGRGDERTYPRESAARRDRSMPAR